MRVQVWVVLALAATAAAGCGGRKDAATTASGTFLREFAENAPAARAKYDGKQVDVTGKVLTIDGNLSSRIKITLLGDIGGGPPHTVFCEFPRGTASQAARLKAGSAATVRGTFRAGQSGFGVVLEDCTIP